jgi:hypothetical protein
MVSRHFSVAHVEDIGTGNLNVIKPVDILVLGNQEVVPESHRGVAFIMTEKELKEKTSFPKPNFKMLQDYFRTVMMNNQQEYTEENGDKYTDTETDNALSSLPETDSPVRNQPKQQQYYVIM